MARTWARKLEEAVPILTLGVGLLALFSGVENWWMIFVVGWVVLTPLADVLVDDESGETGTSIDEGADDADPETDTQGALATLRDRYARGELTEDQFERKVERLLATETVEDARERIGGADTTPSGIAAREGERTTE